MSIGKRRIRLGTQTAAIFLTLLWAVSASVMAALQFVELRHARAEVANLRALAQRPAPPPLAVAAFQQDEKRCRDPSAAATDGAASNAVPERLVDRLRVLAVTTIAEMETTIRLAGLDPAEVAPPQPGMGQGGPYVAPGRGRGEGGGLAASLTALDVHLDRWDELNRVVRSLPLTEPLRVYRVASPFGLRLDPFEHRVAVHEGIDLAAPFGSAVLATAPGRVVFAGRRPGLGRVVEMDHGHDVHTVYGHLRAILVRPGQRVAVGKAIGYVGSTGRSTGPHLHYEIRVGGVARDPAQFLYTGRLLLAGLR